MKKEFKIGDLVVLNSGGPVMTIISPDEQFSRVKCAWFTREGELRESHFKEETIRKTRNESKQWES